MMSHITIRRVMTIALLTLAWCGLWRSISLANILSGVVVSTALIVSKVGTSGRGGVRLIPLFKLLWLVFKDLVSSTISVAVEILTPTDNTEEAIVAVVVPTDSRHHLLLLVVAITLTPGTAVVDTDPESSTLYLHLLHVSQLEDTVAHVEELARLACEALPVGSVQPGQSAHSTPSPGAAT